MTRNALKENKKFFGFTRYSSKVTTVVFCVRLYVQDFTATGWIETNYVEGRVSEAVVTNLFVKNFPVTGFCRDDRGSILDRDRDFDVYRPHHWDPRVAFCLQRLRRPEDEADN